MALQIRRRDWRGLRLWPVGLVLVLAFATAIIVAAGAFYTGWDLLGARGLKQERRLDSKTLFDLVKLSFGVVAGSGALVALIVAYRRQRIDEDGALREATRLHTERFTTAVGQLGEDSPAVRLGGVHALAGLADDAPTRDLRQTCIDVLCAYLRLPYAPEPAPPTGDATENPETEELRRDYQALQEIRHTIIRLIRDHLRLDSDHSNSWQGHDFDFTGVAFDGGDFSHAWFSGGTVTFASAKFSSRIVSFRGAHFSGGTVHFSNACISGGILDFDEAKLSGGGVHLHQTLVSGGAVSFEQAELSGGTLNLGGAQFSGGIVSFARAHFSGTEVGFSRTQFSGGTVRFNSARFAAGTIIFARAQHSGGGLTFSRAHFSGSRISFAMAQFSGGEIYFGRARFSGGAVHFSDSRFSGTSVTFREARFSGGAVVFNNSTGAPPDSLIPEDGSDLPPGLTVPDHWIPSN